MQLQEKKLICFLSILSLVSGFVFPRESSTFTAMQTSSSLKATSAIPASLVEPSERDSKYGPNIAQYLIDLHDNKATFDFCGGMMFQLMLTDALYAHLKRAAVSSQEAQQPRIFDASKPRMFTIPNYSQSAFADDATIFHGRELRQIPDVAGGMGFVLQLSLANEKDPQGWTKEEIDEYDGWGHDSGRTWRKADRYEAEGVQEFKNQFGSKAFGLHHRFYLHFDSSNRMWLAAEDGCEGTPSQSPTNAFSRMFGL